jgi:hypothetical protein
VGSIPSPALVCLFPSPNTSQHGATAIQNGNPFPNNWPGTQVATNTPATVSVDISQLLPVVSAASFYVGEKVLIYEPQPVTGQEPNWWPTSGFATAHAIKTITGVDTGNNVLWLDTALATGYSTSTAGGNANGYSNKAVVVGLGANSGTELSLRGAVDVSTYISIDMLAGAANKTFGLKYSSVSSLLNLVVGDWVLLDSDGDLATTPDQSFAQVTKIVCAPSGNTAKASDGSTQCNITLNAAPTSIIGGRSKVILLGDSFTVTGGTKDSSGNTLLDRHGDQFSIAGTTFIY